MTGAGQVLALVAPEPPRAPRAARVRLTPAIERAMRKALRRGGVGRSARHWREPFLDRPAVVDRAIARGWLAPTWAFNRYTLTAAGRARLVALNKIRRQRK